MGGCCGASTVAPEHDELTPRTLEKISEMFHRYDTDNDQYMSFDELLAVMRSMGHNPMPAELEHMIREVDNSNTGMVNIDGFVDLMTREWEAGNPGELMALAPQACPISHVCVGLYLRCLALCC